MSDTDSHALRRSLRQTRKSLTPEQQQEHAQRACQHLLHSAFLNRVHKIALFLSQDGELDTHPLIKALWSHQAYELYLPALETQPDWHMGFSRYTSQTRLVNNRFGIPEPDLPQEQHLTGKEMDLVVMPLVGFDAKGNRMGMGGGYYDRTFAFKLEAPQTGPNLIGWAHRCQQVEQLPVNPWDVPLNGIITETGAISF